MDKENQRIAIAEACGWSYSCRGGWGILDSLEGPEGQTKMPDYLNDLNAIHEAENLLLDHHDWGEWIGYCVKLLGVIDSIHLDQCVRATASQRAEALLKTLNLWKE